MEGLFPKGFSRVFGIGTVVVRIDKLDNVVDTHPFIRRLREWSFLEKSCESKNGQGTKL